MPIAVRKQGGLSFLREGENRPSLFPHPFRRKTRVKSFTKNRHLKPKEVLTVKASNTLLSLVLAIALLAPTFALGGTTGKIAGFVKDKETGDPLPGVSVTIEGTMMGAATDIDGYYWEVAWGPMFEFTENGEMTFKDNA